MTFAFFDTFGLVHSVTQGGPGDATSLLVYKAWKDGFENLQLGLSAAQSVVLMAVVIGLTALQFRFAEKKVTY
jgi:sn-glycerol 3-phosphate transport system permease protein